MRQRTSAVLGVALVIVSLVTGCGSDDRDVAGRVADSPTPTTSPTPPPDHVEVLVTTRALERCEPYRQWKVSLDVTFVAEDDLPNGALRDIPFNDLTPRTTIEQGAIVLAQDLIRDKNC